VKAKVTRKAWRKARHFISGKLVAADTETTGLDHWHDDQPFAFSFCNENGDTAYFEWPVDPLTRKVEPIASELKQLKDFFEDEEITKSFFNAKFDVRMIETFGIVVAGPGGPACKGGLIEEVMFMAFIFNNFEPSFKLKVLANKYCEIDNSDEVILKKTISSLRKRATALGWKIAWDDTYPVFPREIKKKDPVPEADYWLPQAFKRKDPAFLKDKFGSEWKEVLDRCREYAVKDAVRTMLLRMFYVQGMDVRGQRSYYDEEMKVWREVYAMERRGILIRPEEVEKEITRYRKQASECRQVLRNIAESPKGKPRWDHNTFDPNSAKECSKLLYKKLGIPPTRFGKTGPSCDKEALVGLRDYEAANKIISYRTAYKAVSTTFGPWTKFWRKDEIADCLSIHTDFQQCGPITGRFSSRRPNLQNVSNNLLSSSLEGVLARRPFGPRPGFAWVSMDYSNLEVRIFAELSGEPQLLKWFADRRDVHTQMTNLIWGGDTERGIRNAVHSLDLQSNKPSTPIIAKYWADHGITEANVHKLDYNRKLKLAHEWFKSHNFMAVEAEASLTKKRTRNRTKQITFNKIFGGGAGSLATLMRCDRAEAQSQIDVYDENFPLIDEYIRSTISEVKRCGYVRTAYGNRLAVDRDLAYRGVNYKVQGSAARLLKRAMWMCGEYLRETGLNIHMILTVHDELYFETWLSHLLHPVIKHLIYLMEDPDHVFKKVDMRVEVALCPLNWEDKREVEMYGADLPTKGSTDRWTRQWLKSRAN
jgi:DNA polymerase I-like protein with 3'-5' exonuclease and polymerase domains